MLLQQQSRSISRRKVVLATLAVLLVVFAFTKDALLTAVLHRQLKKVPQVEVSVGEAHLSFVPGGVSFHDVKVARPADPRQNGAAGERLQLAAVKDIDVSWHWFALLRGALVADANVDGVDVTIWRVNAQQPSGKKDKKAAAQDPSAPPADVKEEPKVVPEPPEAQTIVAAWPEIARFVLPMAVDYAAVKNMSVTMRDLTTTPEVNYTISGIRAEARNLTNRAHLSEGQFANVTAYAPVAAGSFDLDMQLDPLARAPTFALRSNVKDVVLQKLNLLMRAYAHLDVEEGTLSSQVAVRSQNGQFKGFVEPRIVGLKIRPRAQDEKEDTFLNRVWRTGVRAVTSLVEDSKEETIATKLPLRGAFVDPEIGVWEAVTTLLGNAYLQSLTPTSDTSVGTLPSKKTTAAPANKPAAGTPKKAPAQKKAKK